MLMVTACDSPTHVLSRVEQLCGGCADVAQCCGGDAWRRQSADSGWSEKSMNINNISTVSCRGRQRHPATKQCQQTADDSRVSILGTMIHAQ